MQTRTARINTRVVASTYPAIVTGYLAAALTQNSTLESLTINADSLSKEHLECLISGLNSNISLLNLNFEQVKINEVDSAIIASLLERNRLISTKYLKPLADNPLMVFKLLYDMKAELPNLAIPGSRYSEALDEVFKGYIDACKEIPLREHPQLRLNLLLAACAAKVPVVELDQQLTMDLFTYEPDFDEKYRLILWLLRNDLNTQGFQNIVNTCVKKLRQDDSVSMLSENIPHLFVHQQQILDIAQKLVQEHARSSSTKLFDSPKPGDLLRHPLIRAAMNLSETDEPIIVDEACPFQALVTSDADIVANYFKLDVLKQAVSDATGDYKEFLADKRRDNRGAQIGFFTRFRHDQAGLDRAEQFAAVVDANDDYDQIINQLLGLLQDPNTRFHNHSYSTYLLDQLQIVLEINEVNPQAGSNVADVKASVIEKLEGLLPSMAAGMIMK